MGKKVRRPSAGAAAALLLLLAGGPLFCQDLLSGRELVDELRRGGYTIYFRHAATDFSRQDQVRAAGEWTSCDPARMRQLSEQGRAEARRIGEAMRALGIPVGQVLSSEYCRTRETALLLGLGPVTPTRSLMNMLVADLVGGRELVVERAREVIGRPPEGRTNTVLVAHGNLMQAATGAYTGEAGAAVFRPEGDGAFTLVAEIAPEDWAGLARLFGKG